MVSDYSENDLTGGVGVSSKYVVLTQINENCGQGGRWIFLS